MEIFAIPAILICLLYLIYSSIHDKKSPILALLCIALFVGLTALAVYFYAAVRTSYLGHPEWAVERAYFLGRLADKLAETNDLKTAAEFMQSEAVKEQTLRLIRQIVLSFRPKAVFYLSAGGLILLLIVGLADTSVDVEKNGLQLAERWLAAGGKAEVIKRPYWGHHPHGLDDTTKIVRFILGSTLNR